LSNNLSSHAIRLQTSRSILMFRVLMIIENNVFIPNNRFEADKPIQIAINLLLQHHHNDNSSLAKTERETFQGTSFELWINNAFITDFEAVTYLLR
jgi:hypothetical protein